MTSEKKGSGTMSEASLTIHINSIPTDELIKMKKQIEDSLKERKMASDCFTGAPVANPILRTPSKIPQDYRPSCAHCGKKIEGWGKGEVFGIDMDFTGVCCSTSCVIQRKVELLEKTVSRLRNRIG
jgi:hypothetical protein